MAIIKCCKDCHAPKRYPGCHDKCPEYQKDKAIHDELKEKEFKRKQIESGICSQQAEGIYKALRHRKT